MNVVVVSTYPIITLTYLDTAPFHAVSSRFIKTAISRFDHRAGEENLHRAPKNDQVRLFVSGKQGMKLLGTSDSILRSSCP